MSQQLKQLASKLAEQFGINGNEQELIATLKATCFKIKDGQVSDAQLAALLIVAGQYGLNPFTKEIYAYPDKNGGIVPVVGVDGWSRIINSNPNFNGMTFVQSPEMVKADADAKDAPEWIECVIYRKDREHPITIREYLDEVYRPAITGEKNGRPYKVNGPWQTHTKRLLRHKTMIQTSRIAFGFVGIYDEDEAERIVERDITPQVDVITADQAAVLRDKLTAIGMDESMFLTKCDIQKLEELPASRLAGATNWLDTRKPAAVTITQQSETGEKA